MRLDVADPVALAILQTGTEEHLSCESREATQGIGKWHFTARTVEAALGRIAPNHAPYGHRAGEHASYRRRARASTPT
jgi:hypothetical protein